MNDHPRSRLDDLIHQPVRFSIVAALASAREVEFGSVRDAVQVSDSLLSRYVAQLEQAGHVAVRKVTSGSGHARGWRSPAPAVTPTRPTWRRCARSPAKR